MWYAATIIIKCSVGQNQKEDFLFDEQVRIIEAKNPDEAYAKALKIGKEQEDEYKNPEGESVMWTFEGIFNLEEIPDPLRDGSEITSKRFRANSSEHFVFPKEKLAVFYLEDRKDKTAKEVLDE